MVFTENMLQPRLEHREPAWQIVTFLSRTGTALLRPGIVKAFGVLLPSLAYQLHSTYDATGDVLAVDYAFYYLACPLAKILTSKFSPQIVCTLSGLAAGLCFIGSAFIRSFVGLGFLLFMTGLFGSAILQTSYTTLRQHYGERFGVANTGAIILGRLGGCGFPFMTAKLLEVYGLTGALLCLGGMLLNLAPIGATFRPPRKISRGIGHVGDDETSTLMLNEVGESTSATFADQDEDRDSVEDSDSDESTSPCRNTLHLVLTNLNFYALKNERILTMFLLPLQILFDFARMGWWYFAVDYAASCGIPESRGVFCLLAGSVGGLVGLGVLLVALCYQPRWGAQFFAINAGISAMSLFIQTVNSSPVNVLICSFFIGFGFSAAMSANHTNISTSVANENYAGVMAVSFFLTGIAVVGSGFLVGYLYMVIGSYPAVFRILGGLTAVSCALDCVYIYVRNRQNGL